MINLLLLCFVLLMWSTLSMLTIVVFGITSKAIQVLFIILTVVFIVSLIGLIYLS